MKFAKKRNLCLMLFKTLLDVHKLYQEDEAILPTLWETIHVTEGEFTAEIFKKALRRR